MVEMQGAFAHTTPLLPPHLVHQHRQVACGVRRERKMMHLNLNDLNSDREASSYLVEGYYRLSGVHLAGGASFWRS